jgi:hypothetical protein
MIAASFVLLLLSPTPTHITCLADFLPFFPDLRTKAALAGAVLPVWSPLQHLEFLSGRRSQLREPKPELRPAEFP